MCIPHCSRLSLYFWLGKTPLLTLSTQPQRAKQHMICLAVLWLRNANIDNIKFHFLSSSHSSQASVWLLCGCVDRVKGGVFPNQEYKERRLQWGMPQRAKQHMICLAVLWLRNANIDNIKFHFLSSSHSSQASVWLLCGCVDRVKGGVFPNQEYKERRLQWGMSMCGFFSLHNLTVNLNSEFDTVNLNSKFEQ